MKEKIAECVGLWLAEGDNKTNSEITFTNNCKLLIDQFHQTVTQIFNKEKYNPRIYVYSKNKVNIISKDCKINYYTDKRANKPYFIYRIYSKDIKKKWDAIVKQNLSIKNNYPAILRGFFAGEGNIKSGSHNSRILRIAQKEQKEFIDNLLNSLKLEFSFYNKGRSYIIYRKQNWDIFAKYKIADLHPDKKRKFWATYNSFKEEHYKKNHLITEIPLMLNNPISSRGLANKFNRSIARIQDILIELKKQNKITNFRVKSTDYWINSKETIIISKLKEKYLLFLDKSKKTVEFKKQFKVQWKSSFKRLKELEKLNLVRRENNKEWIKLQTKNRIIAL